MPTSTTSGLNILGTYPIINKQMSSIDDNGVETLSYAFTVKTADVYKYVPSKDDEYYGPNGEMVPPSSFFDPSTSSLRSKYLVTSVSIDNLNGGLTQIVVNTAGTKNSDTPPKIRLLPNYPLIFGLKGVTPDETYGTTYEINIGNGGSRTGFGVMLTFITKNTIEAEVGIYTSLSNKLMPPSFRDAKLPTPNRQPFYYTSPANPEPQSSQTVSFTSQYFGFICGETTYTKIGGVIVFQLIYREMGSAYSSICPTTGGACETNTLYNFN